MTLSSTSTQSNLFQRHDVEAKLAEHHPEQAGDAFNPDTVCDLLCDRVRSPRPRT